MSRIAAEAQLAPNGYAKALIEAAATFCELKDITLSRLGLFTVNDHKLFSRLANRETVTLRNFERAAGYMRTHWPTDIAMPTIVSIADPADASPEPGI